MEGVSTAKQALVARVYHLIHAINTSTIHQKFLASGVVKSFQFLHLHLKLNSKQ